MKAVGAAPVSSKVALPWSARQIEAPRAAGVASTPLKNWFSTTGSSSSSSSTQRLPQVVAVAATAACELGYRRGFSQRRGRARPCKVVRRALKSHDFGTHVVTDDGREFEILKDKVLGSGAQGTVYRGIDKSTGQAVAIKVLPTWRLMLDFDAESKIAGIEEEYNTLRRLSGHPNVAGMIAAVDIYPEEQKEGVPRFKLMIMEIVEGQELAEHVARSGPMMESLARHIFLQMIDALGHLHRQGVIHRDLKPENVMVTGDQVTLNSSVKLIDFGVAKCLRNGPLKTVVGTPAVMAPEVAREKLKMDGPKPSFSFGASPSSSSTAGAPAPASFDWGQGVATGAPPAASRGSELSADMKKAVFCPKIDVWAAGVVLYTCLTGKFPFKSEIEIIEADYLRQPLQHASQEAIELLAGMLEKDPERRLSLNECLYHPWVACSETDGCTIDWDRLEAMGEMDMGMDM